MSDALSRPKALGRGMRPVRARWAGLPLVALASVLACSGGYGPLPSEAGDVEQTAQGSRPPATLVASFDGLGVGFEGPHGPSTGRNPSDNSLAVGPDHIVQTVNSRLAVFTKRGERFDTTGRVLYGSVPTHSGSTHRLRGGGHI